MVTTNDPERVREDALCVDIIHLTTPDKILRMVAMMDLTAVEMQILRPGNSVLVIQETCPLE